MGKFIVIVGFLFICAFIVWRVKRSDNKQDQKQQNNEKN